MGAGDAVLGREGEAGEMSEPRIDEQTEKEMIESILRLYVPKENWQCASTVADHIAIKLTERRALIRERRKKAKLGK